MKKTEFINAMKEENQAEATEQNASLLSQATNTNVLTDFVPNSTKKTEKNDEVILEYSWKDIKDKNKEVQNSILITSATFKKSEKLENLYHLGVSDGTEEFSIIHNGVTFILRKTEEETVRLVLSLVSKLGSFLEKTVGYLKTTSNNFYLISKVDSPMWTFDKEISGGHISYIKPTIIGERTKTTLCELVAQKFGELHSNNFVFGTFNLHNILFNSVDLQLSDLRKLRAARTKQSVVDEFISVLNVLISTHIAKKIDLYPSVAYYVGSNTNNCGLWYSSKFGKKGADAELADKILEEAADL